MRAGETALLLLGLLVASPAYAEGVLTTKLQLAKSKPIPLEKTHHVQGLAADGEHFYLSSVDRGDQSGWLFVLDKDSLRVLKRMRWALGDQYHPGGMQLRGGTLFFPLAEYRPTSTASIIPWQPRSNQVGRTIPADDHLGGVAVAEDGTIYGANWDAREFLVFAPDGKFLEKKTTPTGIAYQDVECHDGKLWCSGNVTSVLVKTSVVDLIEINDWKHVHRYIMIGERRTGGSDFAHEGFTKDGDRLVFVPEDGPNSTLYWFDLPGSDKLE